MILLIALSIVVFITAPLFRITSYRKLDWEGQTLKLQLVDESVLLIFNVIFSIESHVLIIYGEWSGLMQFL